MRVVYLTPGCFDKGGISRYCRYQIEALREVHGFDNVKVLSLLGPDENGFETPFQVDSHGNHGGLWDKLKFSIAAARFVLSSRADMVHVAHVNMTPLALPLARLTGAKTLLNVYGLEIWSGLSPGRRQAMAAMSHVVADCHFTANFVSDEGMHAKRPSVIWDCVDLERFTPGECSSEIREKYGLPNKREVFVVMSFGRLGKRASHKGYDRLIQVFARLLQQKKEVHLVIGGQGDDQPRLEALVDRLNLTDHVIFTGPIEEADLADFYRSASVFSLVSDRGPGRGEGIPLTPLEAMSCGIPIIVGNQDGSKEAVMAIDEVGNGFAIDPFDLDQHAKILVELASSESLQQEMGIKSRAIAEQFFGFKRFVEEHQKLYSDLFAASQGKVL